MSLSNDTPIIIASTESPLSDSEREAKHRLHGRFDGIALALGAIALVALTAIISQQLSPFILIVVLFSLLIPFREYKASRAMMFTSGAMFLFWLVITLASLLLPFIIGLLIAYLFNPLVTYLQTKKQIPRGWSSAVIVLLLMLIVFIAGYILIPIIFDQFESLADKAIKYMQQSNFSFDEESIKKFFIGLGIPEKYVSQYIQGEFLPEFKRIISEIPAYIVTLLSNVPLIFERLFYIIIIPISIFYFLKDWYRMSNSIFRLIPSSHQPRWNTIFTNIDRVLYAYIRGQSTVAIIIGILAGIIYSVMGVPYAIILALVIMFLDLIPIIGLIASVVIVEAVIMLTMPMTVGNIGGGALVILGLHTLEAYFIGPKIVGKGVGIPPITIIISIFIFGYFLGFLGMLIAVPLAGIILLFGREYRQSIETYTNSGT